jgi:hypothetical protein
MLPPRDRAGDRDRTGDKYAGREAMTCARSTWPPQLIGVTEPAPKLMVTVTHQLGSRLSQQDEPDDDTSTAMAAGSSIRVRSGYCNGSVRRAADGRPGVHAPRCSGPAMPAAARDERRSSDPNARWLRYQDRVGETSFLPACFAAWCATAKARLSSWWYSS